MTDAKAKTEKECVNFITSVCRYASYVWGEVNWLFNITIRLREEEMYKNKMLRRICGKRGLLAKRNRIVLHTIRIGLLYT